MSSDPSGVSGQSGEPLRLVDDNGVEWSKFHCEYSFESSRWAFDIWARNWADAKARVAAICAGVEVHERFYERPSEGSAATAFVTADHTIDGQPVPDEADFVEFEQDNDVEALFNLREWAQEAFEAKGAIFTGGGIGFGGCDLDIELEGFRYNVTITPVLS